jgi:hypothetical protein
MENLDTSQGWCCDGRTHKEHEAADGKCCQPAGKTMEDLPPQAQQAARDRMSESGGQTS